MIGDDDLDAIAAVARGELDRAVVGAARVLLGVVEQVADDARERVAIEARAQVGRDVELEHGAGAIERGLRALGELAQRIAERRRPAHRR